MRANLPERLKQFAPKGAPTGVVDAALGTHPELDALNDSAAELDLFYVVTRYPNGLVDGTPHRVFTRAQAERALECAERILTAMKIRLGG